MSSLRAMVSASGREHEHIAGQSLRAAVLGDAPLTLEDQPVVLGDADRRVARGRGAEDQARLPTLREDQLPGQNGLICAAVATDSVSEGSLI